MEPRGTASHTATAMDPIHGSQWSVSSTDTTLTAQQGAVLRSSYGSDGMGEVSSGSVSMAFMGQRSQPRDAARQPFSVNDTALPGQSSHSAAVHGDTPMEVEMAPRPCRSQGAFSLPGISILSGAQPSLSGVRPPPGFTGTPRGPGNFQGRGKCQPSGRHRPSTGKWKWGRPWPVPPSSLALPDQLSISLPGISRLPGAQPSLPGVRPPPGFTGTPMGSGEFSGPGQTPAIRQAPPLHFGRIRPLPNRTTATITSVTAPAVTMASYGGVYTSTSLGRPISSLGIVQNNQVSAPLGQTQQQWSGAIPQGVQLPYTQGTS